MIKYRLQLEEMCWNPEVSMTTFLFSTTAVMLAYYNNIISFSYLLFLMSFISMQLIEFFLWINLNDRNLNKLFSALGYALILSQPLFALLSTSANYPYKQLLVLGYIAFVIIALAVLPIDYSTEVGKNKHLQWNWLNGPLYFGIPWFLFFFAKFFLTGEFGMLSYTIITVVASYYSYKATSNTSKPGVWGTMWCWFANGIAFYYYYLLGAKFIK